MEIKKGQIWEVKAGNGDLLPEFVEVESDPLNGLVRVKCDIIGMFDVITLNVDDVTRMYDLIATTKKSVEKGQIWVTDDENLAPMLEVLNVNDDGRSCLVMLTLRNGVTSKVNALISNIKAHYHLQEDKMEQLVKLKDMPTDQWNEIVSAWLDDPKSVEVGTTEGKFYPLPADKKLDREHFYRVVPKKLMDIPWHLIKDQYKFAFMDNDGSVFVSPSEPKVSQVGGWVIPSGFKSISSILNIDITGIQWQTSVTPRPTN